MKHLLAIAALCLWTATVSAQETAGQLPVTIEKVDVAKRMFEQQGFDTQMREGAALMGVTAFEQGLKNANGGTLDGLPNDLLDDMRRLIAEEMYHVAEQAAPQSLEAAAEVYARYFTLDELRRIAELQSDPVFVKLNKMLPHLSNELARAGMEAMAPYRGEIADKIAEVVAKWAASQDAGTES